MQKLCLAGVAFSLSFGLAELAFRLLREGQQQYSVAATGNQYLFYQFDPVLGWANSPGREGTFKREEFDYRVSINEHGMRQRCLSKRKPAGIKRIAVLGDSFVWGIGVSDDERLTEFLDDQLPNTEVLNFGVSGFSPVQYYLMVDRVLEFEPDLVILAFCLGNDFSDNVQFRRYNYYKPYATLDASRSLQITGYPLPVVSSFGTSHRTTLWGSRILGELFRSTDEPAEPQRGLARFTEDLIYQPRHTLDSQERQVVDEGVAINKALLHAISEKVRAGSSGFLVVPIPTKREYNPKWESGHAGYFHEAEVVLQKTCEQLGVRFLPTVKELHGDDFWEHDGHWQPVGHKKMATAIRRHLQGRKSGW